VTHVCTTGVVASVSAQRDGDIHIKVADGAGRFIIAEIIPGLRVLTPPPRVRVRVCGIRRYDDSHRRWELHPLESWSTAQ
jgi:hypothetical protein